MTKRQDELVAKIKGHGIVASAILDAFRRVPRERFVPSEFKSLAYRDAPLPIGFGQTISQPSLVAMMTAELNLTPQDQVLEVGTGCGYQTAILAELARQVFTIELRPELSHAAQQLLHDLGYSNICFRLGDGAYGWKDAEPFDAIIVTAAARQIPQCLMEQLRVGGLLIIPIDRDGSQELVRVRKTQQGFDTHQLIPVRFVPLVAEDLTPH